MTGKRIGYVRVSTADQNVERQLEGLSIDKKFIDQASAKSRDRPQLQLMLDFIREDDEVFIHSMDRLARNLRDLKALVDEMVAKKVKVHFLKENLQFCAEQSPLSTLTLHLMGAFAEFEHSFILERQKEGIAIAQRKGKYRGRKHKLDKEKLDWLTHALTTTRRSKTSLASHLGVSRQTLYKYLREIEQQQQPLPERASA